MQLKSAHEDKVRNAKMQLEKNKKDLTRYTDTVVPAAEADAKAARDLSGDNFVGRVNGKTVTKRKEFGALVIDANKKAFTSKDKLVKIGSISGFDMYASNSTFTITIMGQVRHEVGINPDSPEGTATRIVNLIDGFKKNAEETKAKLQQLKDSIPALEEVANQKFDHEEEYEATVARAKEIEEELKKIQELDADVSDDAYEIDPETGEILEDTREVLAMKIAKETGGSSNLSIKEQIKGKLDSLSTMNAVATVERLSYVDSKNRTNIINSIVSMLSDYDFNIETKEIGNVVIDRKRIKESLKYETTDVELMAYQALADVLKEGIVIGRHKNHKLRDYGTVTIAAPVDFIDSEGTSIRGNVAVVVKKTTDNFYKVHRVLADDGSSVKIKKEADTANLGVESLNSNESQAISAAFDTDNVTQPKKKGNKNQIGDGDNTEAWEATKASDNDVEKPKTLSEIIAGIQHDFGINITNGNIRGSRILGEYNTRDKGIKTRITNNLPTVAHELGHWFDKKYSITSSRDIPRAVREELRTALGELASEYSQAERLGEGFAEFMRLYLQNRETAAIDYPEATKYLLSKLEAKDLSQLTALADEVNAYYAMGADTAQSAIVDHENRLIDKRTRLEKFYDEKDHLYQKYVDSLHGIRRMGQSVDSNKSYIYASNAAYSDARAVETLTSDLRDIDGNYVGKGLKASLEGINIDPKDQKYRDFSEYLVCAHGIEFLKQGKRVFADDRMNSTQYMENRLNELENKYSDFRHISENLYEFLDNFTQTYAVDTGLISQNAYDEMKEMYPRYVPFFRAGYKSRGNSLFRAKGSGREIINPIDNIITMVVKTTNAATRNNVLLKIREEALNLGVNALFIEKIPAPLRPKRFDATGLKQELTENVMDAYVDTQGDPEFANSVFGIIDRIDDVLVQFEIGRAKDNVVQIFVGGNKEFWKVNDELLLESITNMNARTSNTLLNAYGKFTRFMTSNITGQNVIWSIFSNAPRDLQTAYVYSGNKNPLPLLKDIGAAYVNSFRHAMGNSVDPLYTEYLAMGGGGAGVWVGDETFVKDVRKQLNANYKRLNANIFKDIQFLSETIEMGPRFAIYASLRRNGRTPQQAFYEAMDLTVNFRRHGTVSKDINKAVQFFNASMQGADKSVR